MHKVRKYRQLDKEERLRIEVLLGQGLSLSAVGRQLGRAVSTISREVGRNGRTHYHRMRYQGHHAHTACRKRHRVKAKHVVFLQMHKDFVAVKLSQKLSPELISVSGRDYFGSFVSAEWIYQWIWQMKFSQGHCDKPYQGLFKFLRHARRKRKRGNKKHCRGNILHRRFIHERPEEAQLRKVKGHLEGDIMLGKNRQPGLLVVLDRKTRLAYLRKLPSKEAALVTKKLRSICLKAGAKTLTLDNDQSFAHHYRVGVKTFFTNPYSAQEKGSVENRIGLIRMYFPKQTDFTKVTPAQIRKVENDINNRPMRMFKYRTPKQMHQKT